MTTSSDREEKQNNDIPTTATAPVIAIYICAGNQPGSHKNDTTLLDSEHDTIASITKYQRYHIGSPSPSVVPGHRRIRSCVGKRP